MNEQLLEGTFTVDSTWRVNQPPVTKCHISLRSVLTPIDIKKIPTSTQKRKHGGF